MGPSYTSQSVNADCQQTINFYPEQIESGVGNSRIALYPSPGTKQFVDLTPIVPPPHECHPLPNNFNIFNSGSIAYNPDNLTITMTPTTDIQIGDTMFYAQESTQILSSNPPGHVIITGLTDDIGSMWGALIPAQYFLNPFPNDNFFQVWYATATSHITAGTPFHLRIGVNYNPTTQTVNNHFIFSNWQELTTLDQVNVIIGPFTSGNFDGTPITLTAPKMFISFIATQNSINPPIPPLANGGGTLLGWAISPASGPRDGGAVAAYLDTVSGEWIAPSGVQNSTWSPQGGAFSGLVVVNASFGICPDQ